MSKPSISTLLLENLVKKLYSKVKFQFLNVCISWFRRVEYFAKQNISVVENLHGEHCELVLQFQEQQMVKILLKVFDDALSERNVSAIQ